METELGAYLIERLNGPFSFRLFLQPCMAMFFAFKDGRMDAANDVPPFLPALLGQKVGRRSALASAWGSLSKVLILAFVLDCAFQYATAGSFALIEALLMALLLCAVPYIFLRGPVARAFKKK